MHAMHDCMACMTNGLGATPPPGRGPNNDAIASNIRAALERLSVSHAELAGRTGLHQSTITRIINGDVTISVENLTRIAEALGIKAGELMPEGHSCTAGA